MSRFYRELHDRELLTQAENTLSELQRRSLVDVILPPSESSEPTGTDALMFPRRLASISIEHGRLVVAVDRSFFTGSSAGLTR